MVASKIVQRTVETVLSVLQKLLPDADEISQSFHLDRSLNGREDGRPHQKEEQVER